MEEIIKKYYCFDVDDLQEYNEGFIFFLNGDYFYFVKCFLDEKYLKNLYLFCKRKNVKCHELVFNKDNNFLSDEFVLMKLNFFVEDITMNDVNYFRSIDCNEFKDKYISLDKIWEMKIDYLEIQLGELSDNKVINNSFDYYVGIVENLILFFRKNITRENFNLCLSHSCLSNLSSVDYYNPLKFSFDYWMKDFVNYIRLSKDYELLENVLEEINNFDDRIYLFVRLIFPYNYFEEVSNVIVEKKSDRKLIEVVNSIDDYDKYIGKIQKMFSIYLFSWIKKE